MWKGFIFLIFCLMLSGPGQAFRLSGVQGFDFGTWSFGGRYGFVTMSSSGTISNVSGLEPIQTQGTIFNGIVQYERRSSDPNEEIVEIQLARRFVSLINAQGNRVYFAGLTPSNEVSLTFSGRYANIPLGATIFVLGYASGIYTGTIPIRAINSRGEVSETQLNVSISFMQKLSVRETKELHFGGIEISGNGSGVVRLAPQSQSRQIVRGNRITLLSSPIPSAGEFLIQGEPNTVVSVSSPTSAVLTSGQGDTIEINNFVTSSPNELLLNNQGEGRLTVGADLVVQAFQKAGAYVGNYVMTVNY